MYDATRSLRDIAVEIHQNWAKPNYAALPYMRAMLSLESMQSAYGQDNARSIVLYFLSNAATWRGAAAKRIKAELREMVSK